MYYTCAYASVCEYPQSSEEDSGYSAAGSKGGDELSDVVLGPELRSSRTVANAFHCFSSTLFFVTWLILG